MLSKFKNAIINVVGTLDQTSPSNTFTNRNEPPLSHHSHNSNHHQHAQHSVPTKFRYTRPHFLQLNTEDEIQVTADHIIRPIIVPRDITKLPWNSGYAETINAGKSLRNEDQAALYRGTLRAVIAPDAIAYKVADMMPTVPGHPQQIPVNHKKYTNTDDISTNDNNANSIASKLVENEVVKVDTKENTEVKAVSTIVNGDNNNSNAPNIITSSSNVCNGPSSEATSSEEIEKPELKVDIPLTLPTSASSTSISTSTSSAASSSHPLDDLLSPSTPLPIEVQLAEAANEDNSAYNTPLTSPEKMRKPSFTEDSIPWLFFGVFDGHAGSGVAVAASNTLHRIIQEKLQMIADLIITFGLNSNEEENECNGSEKITNSSSCSSHINGSKLNSTNLNGSSVIINQDKHLPQENIALLFHPASDKIVTVDSLVIGALEQAFWEMDNLIAADKRVYRMSGGCTCCIGIFLLGKLYVANAGDSRGIICKKNLPPIEMSFDFTPESERERIKYLGLLRPELLGNDFTHLEFVRRPTRRDLGKRLLCRDAYMSGWAFKTVTLDDLKFPLVYGEGKRSRVLATIGVTRGFGDHELKAQNSDVDIKPFLTPQPEVRIYDLEKDENLSDDDVLVLGTDGLWDITTNEQAAEIVQKSLDHFPQDDKQRYKYRYISAAQDLVMHSRGKSKEKGKGWKTMDNKSATIDDISVFVIPIKPYKEEYAKWKSARDEVTKKAVVKHQGER